MKVNQPISPFVIRGLKWRINPRHLLAAGVALAAAANGFAAMRYVDLNSPNPTAPYTNWATAATVIQDAVDAAEAGDEVVVTNGTYGPIMVGESIAVRSVNGPTSTLIKGAGRCVFLWGDASLSGFTLTGGVSDWGGGVYCESFFGLGVGVVSNCVILGNVAEFGGGAFGGTLNNCVISNNRAYGQGAGVYNCTLNNCMLIGNAATNVPGFGIEPIPVGGGACSSTLNNCTLIGNSVTYESGYGEHGDGGGAYGCMLNSCVLIGNSAYFGVGGAVGCIVNNCILYFNSANYDSCLLNYCCTTPMPGNGVGNITDDPLFVDLVGGNLRLQSNSPCINAGNNNYVTTATDLDFNPRILGGTVDIGAYEFVGPELLVQHLIGLVTESGVSAKRPLLASLEAALASVQRGNTVSAVNQLQSFQNKVRAQVEPLDSALAMRLTSLAQKIASALDAEKGAAE